MGEKTESFFQRTPPKFFFWTKNQPSRLQTRLVKKKWAEATLKKLVAITMMTRATPRPPISL